ncbi:hypothetical protein JTE90_017172 [Oedothorax gibbosus]|uniref:Uncharacterized protein n=1 Tax=Oedothorax gibbosus TaxID=931172 RepID=A0AAV6V8K4_9ARAC|nr:hypothetical protein JTE90_017172 [Oedothorax gibbosus]
MNAVQCSEYMGSARAHYQSVGVRDYQVSGRRVRCRWLCCSTVPNDGAAKKPLVARVGRTQTQLKSTDTQKPCSPQRNLFSAESDGRIELLPSPN